MADRDERNWWRRIPEDGGFRYLKVGGEELKSATALARIACLAIPPAWEDVHIAPSASRKVQAWGRDAAGRKQYIYSDEHVQARRARKWARVLDFARVLPELRAATNADLQRSGLVREKVLATVVRLMSRAFFRVGSERYAVENRTYGICTLRKRHLRVCGNDLIFTYVGKRKLDQRRVVAETPLVEIVEELLELKGKRLFQYRGEAGGVRPVRAAEVNAYLRALLGERYTSKDIRTFGGTVRAATILADMGAATSARDAHRNVVLTCKLVAAELGNTPAICRRAYVHPAVLEEYEAEGRTIASLMRRTPRPVAAEAPPEYYPEEAALVRFLERYG